MTMMLASIMMMTMTVDDDDDDGDNCVGDVDDDDATAVRGSEPRHRWCMYVYMHA